MIQTKNLFQKNYFFKDLYEKIIVFCMNSECLLLFWSEQFVRILLSEVINWNLDL